MRQNIGALIPLAHWPFGKGKHSELPQALVQRGRRGVRSRGQMVAEPKTENAHFSSADYVQRVTAFLEQVSGWCRERGLTVDRDAVTLSEELMAQYDAPSLHIAKDGVSLARILPVGSNIIGAQGRVDLIGRVARHAFLFCVGKGPASSPQTIASEKTSASSSKPMLSDVDGAGWYWIEARVRRAKPVDESLFIDLLTDVSDHEFE